jgi:tRNA threonylcarbamoyladenosine biosynthesis protein TsaB
MNLLVFDTSMGKCSVAISCNGSIKYQESEKPFMQSEELFPIIMTLLEQNDLSLSEIDAIACTIGPGSFTGIRIGIAAARGIKKIFPEMKLLGISTLELLAYGVHNKSKNKNIVALIDAYRNEFYTQRFNSTIEPMGDITLVNKKDLNQFIEEDEIAVSNVEDNVKSCYISNINAMILLKRAKKLLDSNVFHDNIYPLYIKNPDITV